MLFPLPTIGKWVLFYLMYYFMTSTGVSGKKTLINFKRDVMSKDDVIAYFRLFLGKSSSLDDTNEHFYFTQDYPEDLYHKIDNLILQDTYITWLMKTKEITDKKGQLQRYGGSPNAYCSPTTVFNQTLQRILQVWDGDRTIVTNELEAWQRVNEHVPPSAVCNRFRGLVCKHNPDSDNGLATTCQCGGNSMNVGFFQPPIITTHEGTTQPVSYPEGCYTRTWRPCKHLSDIGTHPTGYSEFHGHLENQRRILAQMVFPVARTHRCKRGTYCLDLIPEMKKGVCWCRANSDDPECEMMQKQDSSKSGYVLPLNAELMNIRKEFTKLIIPAVDAKKGCNPEYNQQVSQVANAAGMDPTKTGVVDIMKHLVSTGRSIKICDFRAAMVCDPGTRLCTGKANCGPGKIHMGNEVCVSDNGYQCQSNEECVQNAKCTKFNKDSDSACVCESGYGSECHLQNRPFFGSRFLPVVSGFRDEEFIKLQVEIYKVLESWEHAMKLGAGDVCDPILDKDSMEVVDYFGSLHKYEKEKGEVLLVKARKLTQDAAGKLCLYTQFLRCDAMERKCVPFVGNRITSTTDSVGMPRIMVEVDGGKECSAKMPKIFEKLVTLDCKRGYKCDFKGMKKFCLPDCSSPYAPTEECGVSTTTPVIPESTDGPVVSVISTTTDPVESTTPVIPTTTNSIETTTPVLPTPTTPVGPTTPVIPTPTTPTTPVSPTIPVIPTPTMPVVPPPKVKVLGDTCDTKDDCPASSFYECSDQTGEKGTCICMSGLVNFEKSKPCGVKIDGACGQARLRSLYPTPPGCYGGECVEINKLNFCRPENDLGGMFISKEALDQRQNGEEDTDKENVECSKMCSSVIRGPQCSQLMVAMLIFSSAIGLFDANKRI